MGVETAFIAAAAIAAGGQILGGFSERDAQKNRAGAFEDQSRLAQSEAAAQAKRRALDVRRFAANQKVAFLKNGVTLEGSPLLALEDTYSQGQEEVNAITAAGNARSDLYWREGQLAKKQGRAAMIGGITGAASTALMAYGMGSQGGLFSGAAKKPDIFTSSGPGYRHA